MKPGVTTTEFWGAAGVVGGISLMLEPLLHDSDARVRVAAIAGLSLVYAVAVHSYARTRGQAKSREAAPAPPKETP